MKKVLNNKGFTLVELLAVIVILAVLALVAMPNVTSMMKQARKDSFTTEVISFTQYAETSYTTAQMSGTEPKSADKSLIKNVKVGQINYDYYCVSYAQLVKDKLVSKVGDKYSGIIELFIPTQDAGKNQIIVSMTNGDAYAIDAVSVGRLSTKTYESATGKNLGKYNDGTALTKSACTIASGSNSSTAFSNYATLFDN